MVSGLIPALVALLDQFLLQQRPQRGRDAEGAGQDHEPKGNRTEHLLGDAPKERRTHGLSCDGGGDEH